MLPLLTRVLEPSEYGQIAVILTVTVAASAVLALGLENAVVRTYILLAGDRSGQRAFVSSVSLIGLTFPSFVTILSIPLAVPFLTRGLNLPVDATAVALIWTALQVSVTIVPMALLRAQERLQDYLRISVIQSVSTVAVLIVLVVGLDWGIRGYFVSSLVGVLIALVAGIDAIRPQIHPVVHRAHVVTALAFGLPLIPHALAHWGLSVSDRLILGATLPASDVGLYYVAYQLGLPLSTLTMALHQGSAPLYAQAGESEQHLIELSGVVTHQLLLTAMIGFAAAVLGPPLMLIVLPTEYGAAAGFVPWIALGYTLYGLYLIPMDLVSLLAGRTRWVWLVTVPAATVNVVLNLLTVSRFGALAAAVNTAIGYAVLLIGISLVMRLVVAQRPLIQWHRVLPGMALFLVSAIVIVWIQPHQSPQAALLSGLLGLLVIPVLLVATGVWRIGRPSVTPVSTGV